MINKLTPEIKFKLKELSRIIDTSPEGSSNELIASMIGRITALEWWIVRELLADLSNDEVPLLENRYE